MVRLCCTCCCVLAPPSSQPAEPQPRRAAARHVLPPSAEFDAASARLGAAEVAFSAATQAKAAFLDATPEGRRDAAAEHGLNEAVTATHQAMDALT